MGDKLPFECMIKSCLQTFQYKVLHRIAAHKYLLQKLGCVANKKWEKCNEVETIEHKYFECLKLKPFSNTFEKWWKQLFDHTLTLSLDKDIFGIIM